MAKTSKNIWVTIAFWAIGIAAVVTILVAIIILTVNSMKDIGNTITGETETIASEDLPISDPGAVVDGHMSNHVDMSEIDWNVYEDKLVATPNVDVQIGNEKIRYGNDVFMTKVELPGSVPELNLLTHVEKQYDYVDPDGLGRSFTYAGQYTYAGDDFLIAGSEEELGKRYLVVTDDRVFTVKVDTTKASDNVHTISNVLYMYEIDDGYVPEVYPHTDGNGNIIV